MDKPVSNEHRDVSGVLLFDKPSGTGSNSALRQVKKLMEARKAGHTGNLDPIATGLLPLCFGQATKVAGFFLDADKRYQTRIRLGSSTDTGDREGQVLESRTVSISARKVRKALNKFVGEQDQVPPMYSAVKVAGKRLYRYARKGITVERKPRRVTVYSIELLSFAGNYVDIELSCSSGFYVRQLAHELGEALGCGGHVESLRRLNVGRLGVDSSVTMEDLESASSPEERHAMLIPCDQALDHLPAVELTSDAAFYLIRGQAVRARDLPSSGVVRLYEKSTGFLGVGTSLGDGRVSPKRLFVTP